jgi:hypothetical protein
MQAHIPIHDINTAGVPLYLEDGRLPDARIDRKVQPHYYCPPLAMATLADMRPSGLLPNRA